MDVSPNRYHRGAALFTALVFLVIITLISLSAMRTSTLELQMARNEQQLVRAVQSAESAVAGVLSNITTDDLMRLSDAGQTLCINRTGCTFDQDLSSTAYSLSSPPVYSPAENSVVIQLVQSSMPAPRTIQSSSATFEGVLYAIDSTYANPNGGGRAEVVQGFLMLVPNSN